MVTSFSFMSFSLAAFGGEYVHLALCNIQNGIKLCITVEARHYALREYCLELVVFCRANRRLFYELIYACLGFRGIVRVENSLQRVDISRIANSSLIKVFQLIFFCKK